MAKRRMHEKEAIVLSGILGGVLLLLALPLWGPMIWNAMGNYTAAPTPKTSTEAVSDSAVKGKEEKEERIKEEEPIIEDSGLTVETRIHPPAGYVRTEAEEGSLTEFLREYPLKKAGSVVKMWDGTEKEDSTLVQAVMKLPMEKENLQQSAGTVSRVYAEYYFSKKEYDKIKFHFNNGFLAEYVKWQEGFRIRTDSTGSIWVNGGEYDVSKKNLKEYMHTVLMYTSVDTMKKESKKISMKDVQPGDVFIQTGTEKEVVMIVDVCENEQGQKAILLARGGKPAQQFHIITNSSNPQDPWYYEEEITYPLQIGEVSFKKGALRRLNY